MRARDAAIGLAVAHARRRGLNSFVITRREIVHMPDELARVITSHYEEIWDGISLHRTDVLVDRGPVVEPAPLTDTRVAFGVAMAKCGPWRAMPMADDHMLASSSITRYMTRPRGHVQVCGWMTLDHDKLVDLDPRRWPPYQHWIRVPDFGAPDARVRRRDLATLDLKGPCHRGSRPD